MFCKLSLKWIFRKPSLPSHPHYPDHWSKSILWSGNLRGLDLTSGSVTFYYRSNLIFDSALEKSKKLQRNPKTIARGGYPEEQDWSWGILVVGYQPERKNSGNRNCITSERQAIAFHCRGNEWASFLRGISNFIRRKYLIFGYYDIWEIFEYSICDDIWKIFEYSILEV